MARLNDLSTVFQRAGKFGFLKRVGKEISDDGVFTLASALAYSWLFAAFPFILFLLTLVPMMPESLKLSARDQLAVGIYSMFSKATADEVWISISPSIEKALHGAPYAGLLSISIVISLWAASGGVAATMSALDRAYDVAKPRPFIKQRPLAILLTIGVAICVVGAIILLPIGTTVLRWLNEYVTRNHAENWRAWIWFAQIVRYLIGLFMLFAALSLLYHFGPNIRSKWRLFTPGSVFCVGVWLLFGLAFRFYVDHYGKYNETYGAFGGVVVLLFIFYMDAVVLLIGAEIDSEIDHVIDGATAGELQAQGLTSHAENGDAARDNVKTT